MSSLLPRPFVGSALQIQDTLLKSQIRQYYPNGFPDDTNLFWKPMSRRDQRKMEWVKLREDELKARRIRDVDEWFYSGRKRGVQNLRYWVARFWDYIFLKARISRWAWFYKWKPKKTKLEQGCGGEPSMLLARVEKYKLFEAFDNFERRLKCDKMNRDDLEHTVLT